MKLLFFDSDETTCSIENDEQMRSFIDSGELNGKTVTCPQHGHKIDITTGNHASLLNLSFNRKSSAKNAYEVKTEGSKVFINL